MKGILWQKLPKTRKLLGAAGIYALAASLLFAGCGASQTSSNREYEAMRTTAASVSAASSVNRAENGNPGKSKQLQSQANSSQDAPANRNSAKTAPDKKYDDTFFENPGVNPFIYTEEEPLSTFAADVDTASYTIARSYINNGSLPPKDAVRVEEFINYFRREYQSPQKDTFSIYTEAAPSYFGKGCQLIEVGLQGKTITEEERKDASLTFVIDVSGSMGKDNRLELVKKSLEKLVDRMWETDRIGIAVYGTNGRKLLNATSGDDKSRIERAIKGLRPEGSTNAAEGLEIGYEMASSAYLRNGVNRVILCTDGVANEGVTDPEGILKNIEDYKAQGITLTCLGFGMSNYNDVLLEELADNGDGSYAYIDTEEEADKVFGREMTGTLQVIAKNVKTQLEFNQDNVEQYRLVGYENRSMASEDFRNNGADAGEVGAGHAVTALYEVKLRDGYNGNIGTVRVRYENPKTGRISEIYKEISSGEIKSSFNEATPRFRFLSGVAETAEILRESYWAGSNSLDDVLELFTNISHDFKPNSSDREFMDLVKRAASMKNS